MPTKCIAEIHFERAKSNYRIVYFGSSLKAQKAKTVKCAKRWGFRQFQKEHQKLHKTALFAQKVHKKCGFAHFLVLLLKLAETPPFCALYCFCFLGFEARTEIHNYRIETMACLEDPFGKSDGLPSFQNTGICTWNSLEAQVCICGFHSREIKHVPICGYRFVSPSPPVFPKGNLPFFRTVWKFLHRNYRKQFPKHFGKETEGFGNPVLSMIIKTDSIAILFGNSRTGITEIYSKIGKFGSAIISYVMVAARSRAVRGH